VDGCRIAGACGLIVSMWNQGPFNRGMTMKTAERWAYNGDVNLEYGGAFIDLSTWDDGYCSAVRVTDLDSACGFTGACMIEHIVILGTDNSKRIKDALRCIGGIESLGIRNWKFTGASDVKQCIRHAIADALMCYGSFDPDDSWDSYQSFHTEIVQMEQDGPMVFDGWKADKRLHNTDLREYVESVHLRD